MFAVIKWSFERSYAVVPESWVSRYNEIDGAFYPPSKVRERILACEPPGDKWRHYAAKKFLSNIESFEEAEKFANNLVEASDSERECDKITEARSNKQQLPALQLFDVSGNNNTEKQSRMSNQGNHVNITSNIIGAFEFPDLTSEQRTPEHTNSTHLNTASSYSMSNNQYGAASNMRHFSSGNSFQVLKAADVTSPGLAGINPHRQTDPNSTFVKSIHTPTQRMVSDSVHTTPMSSDLNSTLDLSTIGSIFGRTTTHSQEILEQRPVPRPHTKKTNEVTLMMIYEAQIKQQRELTTIKSIVMNIAAKDDDEEDLTEIPYQMSSQEELYQFDEKLQDKTVRNKLHKFMVPFFGENHKKGLKAVLFNLGTIDLWSQFSLRGQRQKKAFQDLNLYSALKRVSVKCNGVSYTAIDEAIGDALRRRVFAKDKRMRTSEEEN